MYRVFGDIILATYLTYEMSILLLNRGRVMMLLVIVCLCMSSDTLEGIGKDAK